MRCFAGSCRFVLNKALALQKGRYENGDKKLGYAGLCKLLTGWRNGTEMPWLKDAPTHPLQQSLKDLERAHANFFAKRADFPRFKKKGQGDSFRYPDSKQIKLDQANSRIFLPKLGWLRYRNSREVLGEVRQVTTSVNGGKWFVGIQTEREATEPIHQSASAIGIDMDGHCPVRHLFGRVVSRAAQQFQEARTAVQALSAGLNKSILDQGWFEFRRQLDCKLVWNGGMLIAAPPHDTSRTCPCCGHAAADNRQTQAKFACVNVVSRKTPMWSARSTYWRGDAALQPVERWRGQAAR
ncbi:MAG: transposase [Desulfobulbus sp.]|nr:transposase [Desulfobulbus sp.]